MALRVMDILAPLVLLSVFIVPSTRTEIFTALVDLKKVLYAENSLATDLRNYITEEEKRLTELRLIADDYEQHSKLALEVGAEHHLGNPLNAFLLVKRFTSDWDRVENLIRNNTSEAFINSIEGHLALFPDQDDLQGAATALLRLQDTYSLPTEKLARGEIQGALHSPELSAADCFDLGRLAYNNGDHYHNILWMGQALAMDDGNENRIVDRALALDYLAYSTYLQGNIGAALNLTLEWLKLEPEHQRAWSNKQYYEKMIAEQDPTFVPGQPGALLPMDPSILKNERQLDDYRASADFQTYEALCRGEGIIPNPRAHELTCFYNRKKHPYFYLVPLREETMFHKPWIAIYHNLLTDDQVALIKELAEPRLARSGVFTLTESASHVSKYRTSKGAWLKDSDHHLIKKVSTKVHFATGLSLETAEELQVVNYGIGGHYEPHYDFARKDERTSFTEHAGNRIATAIYYMTDVEAGGATVFPQIGVKLWPEKGAMAFWYNLLKSGEGDYDTRHAACPVLTGSKWVCNKWIHERGQEFLFKCDINPQI